MVRHPEGGTVLVKINCRARVSPNCYHGREATPIYGEVGMAGDGTFNGESVVCDACYILGGQPSLYAGDRPSRGDVLEHVDREMGL